jgi:hypothetical protein
MEYCLYCYKKSNINIVYNCEINHKLCLQCMEKSIDKCIQCYPYLCKICNLLYKYKDVENYACSLKENKHFICNICISKSFGICMLCKPLETTISEINKKTKLLELCKQKYIFIDKMKSGFYVCYSCDSINYKYIYNSIHKIIYNILYIYIIKKRNYIINIKNINSINYYCLSCEKKYCMYCSNILEKNKIINIEILKNLNANNNICEKCSDNIMEIKNDTEHNLKYIMENVSQCYYCYDYRLNNSPDILIFKDSNLIKLTLNSMCDFCKKIKFIRGLCKCGNTCIYNKNYCIVCSKNYCKVNICNDKIYSSNFCKKHIILKCKKNYCSNIIENDYTDYCYKHIKKCSNDDCKNNTIYNSKYCILCTNCMCIKCNVNLTYENKYCYKCLPNCNICLSKYYNDFCKKCFMKCIRCTKKININKNYKGKLVLCIECRNNGKDFF